MKGAVLEVLLVSAEGIDYTNIVGSPTYHVIVQCGTQVCRSKTSSGNPDIIYWNEKFTFELPPSELETLSHVKLRIVNEEYFTDGEFVGETILFANEEKTMHSGGTRYGPIHVQDGCASLGDAVVEASLFK
ncbi:UNVERIFIED_CONTAM: hypothetical protein Sradi_0512600 [Sesamum radiatum]|uniref:C2 domain-containing protein n=1 Tax=Sesamum radiatum TaxID=300843 RepID=A0AAW2VKC8_SESRA